MSVDLNFLLSSEATLACSWIISYGNSIVLLYAVLLHRSVGDFANRLFQIEISFRLCLLSHTAWLLLCATYIFREFTTRVVTVN
jgi:hypothetical protein